MSDIGATNPKPRATRPDVLVLAMLALSLCGNVVLGVALSRLISRVGTAPQGQSQQASGPAVGTQLPTLSAERYGEGKEAIAFSSDQRPTLIYVFAPECHWCSRNLDNLRALVAEAGKSHRVIGISLDPDVENYVQKTQLRIPIYVRPSRETFEALGLGSTPQTIVVSDQGKVLKTWVGAYAGGIGDEVEKYFHVSLPGLLQEEGGAKRSGN